MFEHIEGLDATAALTAAVARRRAADRAEVELLELAAHWADLHAVLPGQEPARVVVPGTQRLVRLAGDGTPEVAEFAPAELGAALGVSSFAGACLVGDALELRHRLPRCWTRARAGRLQAWRARRIADATKILPPEGAAWVDAQVVSFADKVGSRRLTDLVAVALVRFDPDEAARRAAAARDRRGVRLGDDIVHGNRSVAIEADPLDVAVFDRTITAIADALAGEGDTDPVQARRAKAIGLIADPDHVLRLLHDRTEPTHAPNTGSSPAPDTGSSSDESAPASTQPASTQPAGRPDRSRTRRSPWGAAKPVLYLHPDAHTLATQGATAVVRVEEAGMLLAGQIREWLGRTDLTIQPVLDLADTTAVDAYECPDRVTEIVTLRNPCCPFPWCNNLTRTKDNDHIRPYRSPDHGGPPGQTGPSNIARPCRRHHRLKTHAGWTCTMPEPGIYLWRSPHDQRYLVDHTGTTNLTTHLEDTG